MEEKVLLVEAELAHVAEVVLAPLVVVLAPLVLLLPAAARPWQVQS